MPEVRSNEAPRKMTEHEVICSDVLRVLNFTDLTQDQQAMVRANLTQRIIDAIGKADLRGLLSLARCADAMEHAHGCITPAEEFLENLVRHHYTGGLKPEGVLTELEEFRRNYENMEFIVNRCIDLYPDGVKARDKANLA